MSGDKFDEVRNSLKELEGSLLALSDEDQKILRRLRKRRTTRAPVRAPALTFGERMADKVAAIMGSWHFVVIQTFLIVVWVGANLIAWQNRWDPYPFILLNLFLSFQAAYAAPIIMMSQNRQAVIDRLNQISDYEINLKAELEIELLHYKMDILRTREMARLVDLIEELLKRSDIKGG